VSSKEGLDLDDSEEMEIRRRASSRKPSYKEDEGRALRPRTYRPIGVCRAQAKSLCDEIIPQLKRRAQSSKPSRETKSVKTLVREKVRGARAFWNSGRH